MAKLLSNFPLICLSSLTTIQLTRESWIFRYLQSFQNHLSFLSELKLHVFQIMETMFKVYFYLQHYTYWSFTHDFVH